MIKVALAYILGRSIYSVMGRAIPVLALYFIGSTAIYNDIPGIQNIKPYIEKIKVVTAGLIPDQWNLNQSDISNDRRDKTEPFILNSRYGDKSLWTKVIVKRVKDGDTVVFTQVDNGKDMNVRLLEVDTLEVFPSRSMNSDAKKFHMKKSDLKLYGELGSSITKRLLTKGEYAYLSYKGNGKPSVGMYNRYLAFVHLPDGSTVNEILVRSGVAMVYKGNKTSVHQWYETLEVKAKSERRGIWKSDKILQYSNR